MYPILFKLGPLTIYTYGFFIFLGVALGFSLSVRLAKKLDFDSKIFSDLIFWSILGGFLGARILYIIIEWRWFFDSPIQVAFSRSGFVFYGGAIGGLIIFYFLTKKYKLNFLKSADIVSLHVPLAHAFGRVGCFFYGCCYGAPTNSFIGILFPEDSPAGYLKCKVLPTQLISALALFLIFFILTLINKKKKFDGQIMFSYFLFYGIFRFIIEFFRVDPRGAIFIFSTSQVIALFFVLIGVFFLIKNKK